MLYDERRYEAALDQFLRSYRDFPSPNSQLYVARCLRSIGRTEEAVAAYERTIAAADMRARREARHHETLWAARRELAVIKPPPPPEQRYVAATWTSSAISATGFASFALFWALAAAKYQDLKSACQPLPCPASQTGAVEAGRDYQHAANISLTVGVAGAVSAVSLFVLGRPAPAPWGDVALSGSTLQWARSF